MRRAAFNIWQSGAAGILLLASGCAGALPFHDNKSLEEVIAPDHVPRPYPTAISPDSPPPVRETARPPVQTSVSAPAPPQPAAPLAKPEPQPLALPSKQPQAIPLPSAEQPPIALAAPQKLNHVEPFRVGNAELSQQLATATAPTPTLPSPASASSTLNQVQAALTSPSAAVQEVSMHNVLANHLEVSLPPAAAPPPPAAAAPLEVATSAAAKQESPDKESKEKSTPPLDLAELNRRLDELTTSLESEARRRRTAGDTDELLPRIEQQLRLLYVIAGRTESGVMGIDNLPPAEREAYKHLLFSLSTWLSEEEAGRAPLRNAKILRSLRDASAELAAASRLDLRNLAFCEKVEYFGWYTEFPRSEFKPKQQVVLYVEVDNFAAEEKGPQAFETELQGSYQIFDASGGVVAERQLPLDREVCRNYRRDYFLAYRIYMPTDIPDGGYRLEITIEDMKAKDTFKGRKLGQAMIDFTIRN